MNTFHWGRATGYRIRDETQDHSARGKYTSCPAHLKARSAPAIQTLTGEVEDREPTAQERGVDPDASSMGWARRAARPARRA